MAINGIANPSNFRDGHHINNLLKGRATLGKREIEYATYIYLINAQLGFTLHSSLEQKDFMLVYFISNHQSPEMMISDLIIKIQNSIISLDQLSWISRNDNRLIIWLLDQLTMTFNHINQHYDLNNLFNNFLFNLDIANIHIEQKNIFLQSCMQQWNSIKLPEKDIKWLNMNNSEQIEWACQYLIKNRLILNNYYFLSTLASKYDIVLASLDSLSYSSSPSDKELFLLKMKKTWSQKKFRDSGKAKKPFHLPLTKHTQTRLEELSRIENVSISKIIERLVDLEYEKYSNTKGKNLYE